MIAVITGDIIHSRRSPKPDLWLEPLKKLLRKWGKNPSQWDFYRGDSFQLHLPQSAGALEAALLIKARTRMIRGLDVRIAIGLGEADYLAKRISESNGPAFQYSGALFDTLKADKCNLAIRSADKQKDEAINLLLRFALIVLDNWSTLSAEYVFLTLQNPKLRQADKADKLGITQASVSERHRRAHIEDILLLLEHFRQNY